MPDSVNRYGATLLVYTTGEDLPKDSPSRDNQKYYVGMFDCKWIKRRPTEPITEVPVIYGAFYITNKQWFKYIRGWDTLPDGKMRGHRMFGGLEPWISIKSWLAGGQCHVIRDIETLHIFHKFVTEDDVVLSNNNRGDMFHWNKFFIAFTMMEYADARRLQDKVIDMLKVFELHILNPTEGRRLIKYHLDYILQVREQNKKLFVRDLNWLCEKFHIRMDF